MAYTTEVSIGADESARFARLSGDFNPLHVDAVVARRTPFGGTVVHGIHLLLVALDRTAHIWSADQMSPDSFAVTFNNPVPTGARVSLSLALDAGGAAMRLTGRRDRTSFSAAVELRGRGAEGCDGAAEYELDPSPFVAAMPRRMAFPPQIQSDKLPLHLDQALLASLFPALAQLPDKAWMADLIATTRLVGMECPGLDSVYSGLTLRRSRPAEPSDSSLRYRIERSDDRFRSIRMEVRGAALSGTIDALFRAGPVEQPSLRQLLAHVDGGMCRGQRALVVGGSRGLGELTAKLILAGSGEVTLTYARGHADAERVCAEGQSLDRSCTARPLDVLARELPDWLSSPFTHVYYFASPPIARNASGRWDQPLFERLTSVYVHAFAVLVQSILAAPRERPPIFVYPSTVFLTRHENGFAEYVVAKAAGEALCEHFELRYGTPFVRPRLPRMRTDQTSGLGEKDMHDSVSTMRDLLISLCASTA